MLLNSFITNLSLHYIISRMLNINNEYPLKEKTHRLMGLKVFTLHIS